MELRTYLAIILRRKWIIAIVTIIFTVFAAIASLLITPTYIAPTTVRVATYGGGIADSGRADINYSQLLMSTYSSILTSGSVKSEIKQELGLEKFPVLTVDLIPNTELMRIKGEATNAETARDIANTAARLLIEKSQELYSGSGQSTQEILREQVDQIKLELDEARREYDVLLADAPEDEASITAASQSIALKERTYLTLLEQYESVRVNEALRSNAVTIVEPAYAPRTPSNPRHGLNVVLGFLVGLVGGVGLAFVLDNLDTTLYTTQQIEAITKLPTVGKIPQTNDKMKIIRVENEYQPEFEAFRRLRTNIFASDIDLSSHTLMVTSAERGEGKSTITANLAVSIAQSGRSVAVVDCDMRLPTLHEMFDHPNDRGLTNVLIEDFKIEDALQETAFPRLHLLTSGPTPPNPTELLGSVKMKAILNELKSKFDIVLLDTPALLSVTDAAVLVPMVDNIVLVVARTRSKKDSIHAVRQQLQYVNAKMVDVVVNRAESNGIAHY